MSYSPPDGRSFAQSGIEPHQPIKRSLNPNWNPRPNLNNASVSKLLLDPVMYKGVPFTGLCDLVGAFLSIKKAPSRATPNNFYIPLMGMFEQWCRTLSQRSPTMVQCTWISHGEAKGQFFLGASCSGCRFGPEPVGNWHMVVKNGRWDLINDDIMRSRGYSMLDCPEMRTGNNLWYGNCAETIPFVMLLR